MLIFYSKLHFFDLLNQHILLEACLAFHARFDHKATLIVMPVEICISYFIMHIALQMLCKINYGKVRKPEKIHFPLHISLRLLYAYSNLQK